MKIAHVITSFDETGGAEIALSRLINKLPGDEHVLIALMCFSKLMRDRIERKNVRFHELNLVTPLDFPRTLHRLRSRLVEEEPTVVLGWMYHANALASMASLLIPHRVPLIWTIHHASDANSNDSLSTILARKLCKLLSRHPDRIVYVGNRIRLEHENAGYSNKKSTVVNHGVPATDQLVPTENNRITIGLLGRWHPAKGHATFFKVFEKILKYQPNARALLAGTNISWENVELCKLLDENNVPRASVMLLSTITDITRFFRSIGILVVSSETEAGPIVVLEAMSHGIPVVSTDVGDAAFMLGSRDFIVPVRDAKRLSGLILDLFDLQTQRQIGGRNFHRSQELFMESTMVQHYQEIMNEVVNE